MIFRVFWIVVIRFFAHRALWTPVELPFLIFSGHGHIQMVQTYESGRQVGTTPVKWNKFSVLFLDKLIHRLTKRTCIESLSSSVRKV